MQITRYSEMNTVESEGFMGLKGKTGITHHERYEPTCYGQAFIVDKMYEG